jgi:hypothetical protein
VFGGEVPRVLLTLLALLALAVPAAAEAKRKVPRGFVGMNWDRTIATAAPGEMIAAQFPAMARAGVESTRVSFIWGAAQPEENGPIDLAATDQIVALAAERRISVLPVVISAPRWARIDADHAHSPAREPGSIRAYARALVDRYGPRGSLWSENPGLPRLPIRDWQFWNEIHFAGYWPIPKGTNRWKSYVKRLKAFRAAVRSRDSGARMVLAGLANRSWVYLEKLYRAGAKRYFDVAAVHPFTAKPGGVLVITGYMRRVMKRHRDRGSPLWITELGRPASDGKVKPDQGLDTTDAGMARWLTRVYRKLAARLDDRAVSAQRAYWYSWATEYAPTGGDDMFSFAGLFAYNGGFTEPEEKPAFDAFVRSARRLEGCTKTSSGTCR